MKIDQYKLVAGGTFIWGGVEIADGRPSANVRWFKTRRAAYKWANENFSAFAIARLEKDEAITARRQRLLQEAA